MGFIDGAKSNGAVFTHAWPETQLVYNLAAPLCTLIIAQLVYTILTFQTSSVNLLILNVLTLRSTLILRGKLKCEWGAGASSDGCSRDAAMKDGSATGLRQGSSMCPR